MNTKQARSTAVEVAKVGALKKAHPVVTEYVLNAIDKVTESAREAITKSKSGTIDEHNLNTIGELMGVTHGLLVALGVSHPKLERIRELVDIGGVGWTKLTGAGGGGCSLTVLKPDVKPKDLHDLESKLDAEGFERFETTLGGDGVGVLMPAVLKNGTDEEGGEEINLDKFLRAEGRDGVERLVGVGVQEKREGWKFWR